MDHIEHVDISFVVIGYNESEHLRKCLTSVQNANMEQISSEIIYVDGGSQDNSIEIAKAAGVDRILGGDRRRRAAENRNLGFKYSKGRFIQFIDGDMVMDAQWPAAAIGFLRKRKKIAAVCGNLKEQSPSFLYQVLQIDWHMEEGEIRHCGGAACWRKDIFEKMGGFPETVSFGEEPYLCWRVRNELGLSIYKIALPMVAHDLGFSGWTDYWNRNVRCGETYAEIYALCYASQDRLWRKETYMNLLWGGFFLGLIIFCILGPVWLTISAIIAVFLLIMRKTIQVRKKGLPFTVSLFYAVHTYVSKLPVSWGECKWFLQSRKHKRK